MNSTETPLLTVSLGREAHYQAGVFAAMQTTPQKGKQVYLNTLAVYAVRNYLKWLKIDTDVSQSDSWNPSLQGSSDVADLYIMGIGKLECCSVLPGEKTFSVSKGVAEGRIGYVAVQFEEHLDKVQLLGFLSVVGIAELPCEVAITNLEPLDSLIDAIERLESQSVSAQNEAVLPSKSPLNLSQWANYDFAEALQVGWQTIQEVFGIATLSPAFRLKAVKRAKQIQLGTYRLALILDMTPAKNQEISIFLGVYPLGEQTYLPENLTIIVSFGEEKPSPILVPGNSEGFIQELLVSPGEEFSVQVSLGDKSVTEYFVI